MKKLPLVVATFIRLMVLSASTHIIVLVIYFFYNKRYGCA